MEKGFKEAVENHKILWNEIAYMIRNNLFDPFLHWTAHLVKQHAYECLVDDGVLDFDEPPRFYCFCCDFTGYDYDPDKTCVNCPLVWPIMQDIDLEINPHCDVSWFGNFGSAVGVGNWDEALKYAELIRDLPTREEK